MNRKLALVIAGIASASALAVVALLLVNRAVPPVPPAAPQPPQAPVQPTEPEASTSQIPPAELAAVSLVLENDLGLEEVLLLQHDGVIELRFRTPAASGSDLVVIMAGLFDWLDRSVPDAAAQRIRLTLTLEGADAGFAEASRASIRAWRDSALSSEAFVESWTRVSLVSTE